MTKSLEINYEQASTTAVNACEYSSNNLSEINNDVETEKAGILNCIANSNSIKFVESGYSSEIEVVIMVAVVVVVVVVI
jgi:hypothetical protein